VPSYRERVGRHSGQSLGPVRTAEDDDLEQIADIETRADEVLSVDVVAQLPAGKNNPESLREAAVVLVAGRPALGFARVDVVDGLAHLEQLSVLPEHPRTEIGGELVEAACRWAADQGFRAITLITFADVPWNAPFYAARGFREIDDLTPGLAELRDWEGDLGLDRVGRRVVMRRDLGTPAPEPGAASPVVTGFARGPRSPAHLSAT
jgi:GNAT superfamily N-acetyltransferase